MHYARWNKNGGVDVGATTNESHGMTGTTTYRSWQRMKLRCYSKKSNRYHVYGGRGIRVCDRWRDSFIAFYEDMGERPAPEYSIDRIDHNGNYEPSNCRWTTQIRQQNNRTNNVMIEYKDVSMSVSDWARKVGMKNFTLHQRLRVYKWSVERALTTPVREMRKLS